MSAELAVVYAALILEDDNVEITVSHLHILSDLRAIIIDIYGI